MAVTATGMPYGYRPVAVGGMPQGASMQAQGVMPPAAMPMQQQTFIGGSPTNPAAPQYGLAGSEAALNQGAQSAIGAMQGGIDQARNALMQQYMTGNQALAGGWNQAQQYGKGALDSINQAASAASGAINQGSADVTGAINQGVSALNQFLPQGVTAYNTLGNYLGLGGADAQSQAMQSFMESPDIAYQKEQAQKAILQNARALGGVGGNALLELSRDAQGRAAQGYNTFLDRLTGVANTGVQTAGQIGSLRGNEASLKGSLAGQGAQAALQAGMASADVNRALGEGALSVGGMGMNAANALGGNLASLYQSGGQTAGDYLYNTGVNVASGRTNAGNALSGISSQQAADLNSIIGSGSSNLGNLFTGTAGQVNQQQGNLAQLLAGLYGQNAASGGNQTSSAQFLNNQGYLQQIAQLMQGVGTAAAASDIQLKQNIKFIGTINGHRFYTWDWNDIGLRIAGDQPAVGVLAQELLHTKPDAVSIGSDGYLRVNYSMVV